MIRLLTRRVSGLLLLASLAGCSLPTAPQPTPTPAPEPPQPAVPTYVAQKGLVVRQVQFSARVQPKEAQQLASGVAGAPRDSDPNRHRHYYVEPGMNIPNRPARATLRDTRPSLTSSALPH